MDEVREEIIGKFLSKIGLSLAIALNYFSIPLKPYIKVFYRICQNIQGRKLSRFSRILAKHESFTIESFPSSQIIIRDDNMALLKYFKITKYDPPLPDPSGSLNQHLSSSAIEEANKEVTAVLGDPAKRHPYLQISPEQMAIIARYAVNHGIVNAVRKFSKDSRVCQTLF